MRTGTVKFFARSEEKRFGFILSDGEEIYFHARDGHDATPSLFVPTLAVNPALREPHGGDRIHFEEAQTQRGVRASPWCFSDEYEQAHKACCPVTNRSLLEKHPFLLDVLKRNSGWKKDGSLFQVNEDLISLKLLRSKGMDWFRAGVCRRHYLVKEPVPGQYEVCDLRPESWWGDGIDEGFTEAATIGDQIFAIELRKGQLTAIIEVDTSEINASGFGYVGRNRGPERRIATIYLP